jgi:aspartate kinase
MGALRGTPGPPAGGGSRTFGDVGCDARVPIACSGWRKELSPRQLVTFMALIVHKYGGTSMGSTERIRNVASACQMGARRPPDGGRALGDERRDQPFAGGQGPDARQRTPESQRELDAAGEQVSVGCWQKKGLPAVSYAGWQVPIPPIRRSPRPASSHRRQPRARRPGAGKVVVITGFQGIDERRQRHHAGPRRLDTSAVAVAAAMKADECLIYTDVDGVYTTDPRIVPEARRLATISFEEMLEMASLGSKVLQIRSVEFAGKYRVPLRVLSSFTPWDIASRKSAARAP